MRRDLVDPLIAAHSGRTFKLMGDGALVEFGSAVEEPHAILNVQYFGSALLAWGVILWFARDLDWAAVRGVLIGSVVGDAVGGLLSVWGISQGLVNAFGWTSVVIYVLLLLGALYFLSTGSRKPASAH
jgi:uncharacterized membrane protein YfcA